MGEAALRPASATTVYYALEFALAMPSYVFTAVFLVRDLHMTPLQLVLMGTVMEATIFVCEVPTSVVADTFGRRISVIASLFVQGAAIAAVGLAPTPAIAIAAWGVWGFGWTFMSGAYEAWITDEVGADDVGPVFLRGTRVSFLGAFVGLGLQAAIALQSLRASVVAGGILTMACAIGCILAMPETGFRRRTREATTSTLRELRTTAVMGGRFVRAQPLLLLIIAITFFAGMSTETVDRLWEAHFIRDIGLPSLWSLDPVVWFVVFGIPALPIGYFAVGRLAKRFESGSTPRLARTLLLLTTVMMVTQLTFGLATAIGLAYVALLIYRVARGMTYPIYMTWLNQQITASSVRATVISITNQSDAFGQAVGGPGLGVIGNVWGIRAALCAGAAVLAPALGLYGRALRHGGREPELDELPVPAEA